MPGWLPRGGIMDVEGALELLGCLAAWRQFEDLRGARAY